MSAAAAKRTVLTAASVFAVLAVTIVGSAGGAPGGKTDRVAPTPPANPHVTGATSSLVYVAWDPAQDDTGVAGYYVYGDTGKATVASPAYVVNSLGCGESSVVALVAFDRAGNRSPRVTTTVSTAACPDTQPPTVPSNFLQAATTQNAVVLAWDPSADNVGVVGYGVYRNLSRIATTSEPTVTLSGLSCGGTYAYSVDATDAAGNRSQLATAFVETAACDDGSPPSAPSNLAVTGHTPNSLSLSWSPSSDNVGIAGYRVSVDGVPSTSVTETNVNLSGLACARSYSVGVDAFDAAGNRSLTVAVSGKTDACAPSPPTPDTTPPSSPTGLAATNVTQTGLTLTWNPSTDNVGVTGYDVYRNGSKVTSVSSTSAAQSGLSCGTTYGLSVVARDAAGNSSPAAQITAATASCSAPPPPTDMTPPSQPGGLQIASTTRTSVSLAWTPSTDNVGVAGYRTYVNGAGGATTTQTSATVSSLACGTSYTFEVDAYDAAGNRSTKASVTRSTAACADMLPPSAPTNLVASSRTATSIALSWNASADNVGVAGYGLYRGGASTGTSSTTSGIFPGLTCNTNYTLAVDAYDAAGNRSSQTVVMVSTTACADTSPPSTPSGLAASNVSQTGLTLSWNASTDNVGVSGYDVYRNGAKVTTVSSTSSPQSGLACGTSYSFGVEAFDAAGNGSSRIQVSATTSACSPPASSAEPGPISGQGYTMRFEDNFDSLDTAFWRRSIWYEPEASASDVYVDNGVLNLVSRQSAGYPGRHAMARTQAWQGGYFEARIRYTASPAAFPAMYMMSDNWMRTGDCSSYKISEYDIFEGFPTNATRSHSGALHRNTTGACGVADEFNANSWTNDVGTDLGGSWHVYSGLWTPTEVRWYVDGVELKRFSAWDTTNQPMRLIFQIDNHGGATGPELRTEVDWIRVWQK